MHPEEILDHAKKKRDEEWAQKKITPPSINTLTTMLDEVRDKDRTVWIFEDLMLSGEIHSYRGYYEHLALGFCFHRERDWNDPVTVYDLIRKLDKAKGTEFTGWKGGEFMMVGSTPVWLANAGESPGAVITGFVYGEGRIFLQTIMDLDL